jgi:hypothetical protein
VVIYEAFVEGKLEAPKHLARSVHDLYFEPKYEEFRPRTIWSLSNAFTSALKELDHPNPQFKATAKLGDFLEARFSTVILGFRDGGAVRPPMIKRAAQIEFTGNVPIRGLSMQPANEEAIGEIGS